MASSLLLSLAMLGQCGPWGCSRPVAPQPIVQAPAPDWGWYQVVYGGRIVWVWGYHTDPTTIRFCPAVPSH
jgi:hypothetical protein